MKLNDYLKDNIASGAVTLGGWLAMLIFFGAYHISTEAAVIISVIYFLTAAVRLTWEFFRRRGFYDSLTKNLEQLDKKYLISEMLPEPDFCEGRLTAEAMREANKSMCENVSAYRRESEEFREYIELWVHEIKLPVASLQLMCHNDGNAGYAGQLKRIDGYIENVLYYARSGNAEKDYIIKEESLKRGLADAALKNREELQERGIAIVTEGLDVNVMTDGKWLAYIFGQLIGNSIKYISPEREPKLTVSAEDMPDRIALHFRDNGIGIPESDLPYIFEKSFTGENGRASAKSTGMGLYIVKKLCDKLGHSVSAESVQGEYTEIVIIFGKSKHNKMQ